MYQWALAHGYWFEYNGWGRASTHPFVIIDWYDCVKWCNARSEKEGKTPAYYTDAAHTMVYRSGQVDLQNDWVNWSAGYRLPTEAEWEKAARGGVSGQRFPWGNTISWSQANYCSYWSSSRAPDFPYDVNPTYGNNPAWTIGDQPWTSPVGTFLGNGYGLHDMAGNVWQWCWDWSGAYSSDPQTDPRGPTSGEYRVIRGGSYSRNAWECRTARRGGLNAANLGIEFGFRSVLPKGQ